MLHKADALALDGVGHDTGGLAAEGGSHFQRRNDFAHVVAVDGDHVPAQILPGAGHAGDMLDIVNRAAALEMVDIHDGGEVVGFHGRGGQYGLPDGAFLNLAVTKDAVNLGMSLPDPVVEYVAGNITSNIRQLEGVVKRLTAYKEILDDEITVDSVKRAIKDVIRVGNYIPTPEIIITETARYYGLDEESIRGQSRSKDIALARQIAMYLCRNLTNLSLVDIGHQFGNRNHATVLSSIRKVEDMVRTKPDMAATIRDITSNINSKN